MRIVLLTQDDPFYLAETIDYLIKHLPENNQVVACILFKASPYGKKMSFVRKVTSSIKIFGLPFFMYYGGLLIKNKLLMRKSVSGVLKSNNIPKILLNQSVNHRRSIEIIRHYAPDLLISIAGNQIFKRE